MAFRNYTFMNYLRCLFINNSNENNDSIWFQLCFTTHRSGILDVRLTGAFDSLTKKFI